MGRQALLRGRIQLISSTGCSHGVGKINTAAYVHQFGADALAAACSLGGVMKLQGRTDNSKHEHRIKCCISSELLYSCCQHMSLWQQMRIFCQRSSSC